MITLKKITNTEIFTFLTILVFKLLNCFAYKQERQYSLLKSKLPFKKVANFRGKLMQNYK